jgi:hypothetical protein
MLFRETVAVYCENRTEHTNTLSGQNSEFWLVKAGYTHSNHRALRVKRVLKNASITGWFKSFSKTTVSCFEGTVKGCHIRRKKKDYDHLYSSQTGSLDSAFSWFSWVPPDKWLLQIRLMCFPSILFPIHCLQTIRRRVIWATGHVVK